MTDWIESPSNTSYEGLPQGRKLSDNPKDYVKYIRDKQEEESKRVEPGTQPIIPVKVKMNDVSEITRKKGKSTNVQ